MALLEQQNVLARLYTDASFRASFFDDGSPAARNRRLCGEEAEEINAIREEIESFARSLFRKRLREVEKLLPITRAAAGEDFTRMFREFAAEYNPTSIRKHLQDALAFCESVRKDPAAEEFLRDAAAYESAKLRHFARERRFSYCLTNHDLRGFLLNPAAPPARVRTRLSVWFRIKGRDRHLVLPAFRRLKT